LTLNLKTSELRRHTVEMSAIAANVHFGLAVAFTFDVWLWQPFSAIITHMAIILRQVSLKSVH